MKLKKGDTVYCNEDLRGIMGEYFYRKGKWYTVSYVYDNYVEITPEEQGLVGGGMLSHFQFNGFFITINDLRKLKLDKFSEK